jgi:hypothetical protein
VALHSANCGDDGVKEYIPLVKVSLCLFNSSPHKEGVMGGGEV